MVPRDGIELQISRSCDFTPSGFVRPGSANQVGIGDNPTEATNDLVDATELLLAMRPASDSPVFTELQELPS